MGFLENYLYCDLSFFYLFFVVITMDIDTHAEDPLDAHYLDTIK